MSTLVSFNEEATRTLHSSESTDLSGLTQLLAVSFSYPPQTEPRAIQVSRLLAHLRLPTVIICEGAQAEESDASVPGVRALRVPLPSGTVRNLSLRLSSQLSIPIWLRSPDHLGAWRSPVISRVDELIRKENYRPQVLATFSFPLVDSIIGLELKRRFGFPWLAHFSDPWVDSPFKRYDPFTKAVNVSLERKVIEAADRLVFTSPETAELVMSKYPSELREKVRTVPHAFEENCFLRSESTDSRLVVRYMGELYQNRTPKPLFDALYQLLQTDPDLVRRFRFEMIGDVHQLDLNALGLARLPEGLVVFRPRVGYAESCSLMASATGLMVIDAPVGAGKRSVFLPSKLIEYVGAGRPIIGLTPQGTAANLIQRLGGWIADPEDNDELARVMRGFLQHLLEPLQTEGPWGNREVRREFDAENVAHAFREIVQELC